MRLTSYFCWKAWSLHVNVCSLLAGPDLSSPSAQDFCVPVCWGIWPSQIALSSPRAHGCMQHSLFRNFLEEGEKVQIACFPLFSLKCIILLLLKKKVRCLLDVEDNVLPGTSATYKEYMFIQRNGSSVVPRSLKVKVPAGMMSRLLTEFISVKQL